MNELGATLGSLQGLRVGIVSYDPAFVLPLLALVEKEGGHAFLVGTRSDEEVAKLSEEFALDTVVKEHGSHKSGREFAPARRRFDPSLVSLLTSGTTGRPKAVTHTWQSLASTVKKDQRYRTSRWFSAYPITLFAGTQVMLQVLLNGSTLVMSETLVPEDIAESLRRERVTHASGTPTFWRRLLMFGPRQVLRECVLEQITMGGEIATQDVLDGVKEIFTQARVVHIYASTELGKLFSVYDGLEGFPARYMDATQTPGVELRVEDGELMARSRHSMRGYDRPSGVLPSSREPVDGFDWMGTGDLVEERAGRWYFIGRRSDLINVGGQKVSPAKVESTLRGVAGISDVRVYGHRNAIMGQIVAAELVLDSSVTREVVENEISHLVGCQLAKHEVPLLIKVVSEIAHSRSMKVSRS